MSNLTCSDDARQAAFGHLKHAVVRLKWGRKRPPGSMTKWDNTSKKPILINVRFRSNRSAKLLRELSIPLPSGIARFSTTFGKSRPGEGDSPGRSIDSQPDICHVAATGDLSMPPRFAKLLLSAALIMGVTQGVMAETYRLEVSGIRPFKLFVEGGTVRRLPTENGSIYEVTMEDDRCETVVRAQMHGDTLRINYNVCTGQGISIGMRR